MEATFDSCSPKYTLSGAGLRTGFFWPGTPRTGTIALHVLFEEPQDRRERVTSVALPEESVLGAGIQHNVE